MMTNQKDKKRWKKEAEQLKKDLDNRKKVIQKREVPISFPNKKKNIDSLSPNKSPVGSNEMDDYLKNQIKFK